MRDELVLQNTTSRIVNFKLRSSSTGQLLAGKVAGDFTGTRSVAGGTSAALSFSAGTAGDAYSSGKICPIGNGTYDWHVPNAMFTALGQSNAVLSCSGAIDVAFDFQVVAVDRGTAVFGGSTPTNVSDVQTAVLAKLPSALVNGRIDASVGAMAADVLTASALAMDAVIEIQSGLVTGSQLLNTETIIVGNISAVQADTEDIQDRIPAALVSGRMKTEAQVVSGDVTLAASQINYAPSKAGDAMTLTSGERTAIATAVDAGLLDAGDATDLIASIVTRIGNTNVDQAAFVAAVKAALFDVASSANKFNVDSSGRVLLQPTQAGVTIPTVSAVTGLTASNLDATISSRMATYAQPTGFLAATFPSDPADQSLVIAATDAIITAVGTRSSQTSVDDIPTNAELATALGTADDAVLAAIAAEAIKTAAIKAKTDQLIFTVANQVDANALTTVEGGTGQYLIKLTLRNSDSELVPYCDVILTESNAGDSIEVNTSGATNSVGRIEFKLFPGTYYVWRNKTNYEFTDPLTLVVANNGGVTVL